MGKVAVQPVEGPQWFVVQTQVNRERQARQHLLQQQFEVYLPMRLAARKGARHPITPFFPRYMFVRFDPDVSQWLSICSTVGVHDILRKAGGQPIPVRPSMVSKIRDWEVDGVIHLLDKAAKPKVNPFKKDDRVTFVEGPFTGMDAIIHKVNDVERVTLFLTLVERGESPLKMQAHTGSLRVSGVR